MHEIISGLNNFFQTLGVPGLGINAIIESCLPGFPLPPDVLLIAMDLANPQKALFYATICTITSVFGGTVGYMLGLFGGRPLFNKFFGKYEDKFKKVEEMYDEYGPYAVLLAAFSPIPYNVFTIASGILRMNFVKFLIASVLGRGGRFFLVSLTLMFFGNAVKKYINVLIIGITVFVILLLVALYLYKKKCGNKELGENNDNN